MARKKDRIISIRIHGQNIIIHADNKEFVDTFNSQWGTSFYDKNSPKNPGAIFYIFKNSRFNYVEKRVQYFSKNFIFILFKHKWISCYFSQKPFKIYIQYPAGMAGESVYGSLFEPIFLSVLERLGLFHFHASCVTKNGAGAIFAGRQGSGKTTSALNMLQCGFKLIADDDIFLSEKGGRIYASGDNDRILLTKRAFTLMPELNRFKKAPRIKKGDQYKKILKIKGERDHMAALRTSVRAIFFPNIMPGRPTTVEVFTPKETLVKSLGLEPKDVNGIFPDKYAMEKQFIFYNKLAAKVKGYNLNIGENMKDMKGVIASLL